MDALPPAPALPPVPPAARLMMTSDEKIWAIGCHLSLLLGVGFLMPLIVWLAKRDDSPLVAAHAREALNFHISVVIYSLVCVPFVFVCVGYFMLLALAIASFVFAIIAAIEASKNGFFHYPASIPIFR